MPSNRWQWAHCEWRMCWLNWLFPFSLISIFSLEFLHPKGISTGFTSAVLQGRASWMECPPWFCTRPENPALIFNPINYTNTLAAIRFAMRGKASLAPFSHSTMQMSVSHQSANCRTRPKHHTTPSIPSSSASTPWLMVDLHKGISRAYELCCCVPVRYESQQWLSVLPVGRGVGWERNYRE